MTHEPAAAGDASEPEEPDSPIKKTPPKHGEIKGQNTTQYSIDVADQF